ncbi:hypothetical protein QQ008_15480 [Fulvivirgaceae bacterium BMA10]|uniref:Acyloxyacyl hydrolase n=1 Tax=Splendidivirga corallicola TaxID=3051826 RepID=A0ABT8KPZ8_9BACT|nr:hypothetical protein [Fulvivirgaceae bacterium BMA10]
MMKQFLLLIFFIPCSINLSGQENTLASKKRLDFAKTYFELGGNLFPSFTGKRFLGNSITTFEHPGSFNPYLNWGGFHFWGHAEFYVSFPLTQLNLKRKAETDFQLTHYVATGARFLPWAFEEKKIRPYIGFSWSALDFKQIIKPNEDQPTLSKDFMLVPDIGFLYGYKDFAIRIGVNYFHSNAWQYPMSKTEFEEISTPKFNLQVGLVYSFESSHDKNPETNKKWNSYPTVSRLSLDATRFGDFFVGIGPSVSFSLAKSEYNKSDFPYLNDKLSSSTYYDIALGYQFNKANLFSALSFRNPRYENTGYGTKQTIQKTSLAFEVSKFLTDYSGFVPYIGLNIAYDHIQYSENTNDADRKLTFRKVEPGITVGWDILPGKTEEYLILRTNLRWYPLSSLDIDNKSFDFSQLEYNLIQVVFYPGRFLKSRHKIGFNW